MKKKIKDLPLKTGMKMKTKMKPQVRFNSPSFLLFDFYFPSSSLLIVSELYEILVVLSLRVMM